MKKVMLVLLALALLCGCDVQAEEIEVPEVAVGGAVAVDALPAPVVIDVAPVAAAVSAGAAAAVPVAASASLVLQPNLIQDMVEGKTVYRAEAPPIDQVEPCDHAYEKHGNEAIRGVMAIRYCGTGLEVLYSQTLLTWLYICPDSNRVQCAVMYVRNCPIPHNGCYPMASVHVTLCSYVYNTVIGRDGFGQHGPGADVLLAAVAAGAGEVVVEVSE